jgi:GNAT superfamily N-acetyltransferase
MNIEYSNQISEIEYNSLRESVGWDAISFRQAQTGLKNTTFQVAAKNEGKPVGMARLISDGGYVRYIADVVVLPAYQGYAIGKTMVGMIMDYIKSELEDGERVLVFLMAAKGKEPFYKQFGFGERPNDEYGAGMSQFITK